MNRREMIMLTAGVAALRPATAQQGTVAAGAASISFEELLCEYRKNPVSIGTTTPRLTWKLRSSERGVKQAAYQIQVSSDRDKLARGEGDLWDSGRVSSRRTHLVPYGGKPLGSRSICYWRVRVWDAQLRVSAWSEIASWSVGLLHPEDWQAYWIAQSVSEAYTLRNAVPAMRKRFSVAKPVRRAVVYVCGLGQYELQLNDARVGDAVLDPAWTNYRKTCFYSTYDVTASLRRGENALGILLGNGMYNVQGGRYTKFKGSFGPPCAILQLEIYFHDGSKQIVVSDDTWRIFRSPITFSCTYGGEDYDARREDSDWSTARSEQDAYYMRDPNHPACVIQGPGGALRPALAPPIKVQRTLAPIRVTEPQPGVYVYDLGQNLSGWPLIRVRGAAGSTVKLVPGELLDAEGRVSQKSAGGGPVSFSYTLKGGGVEEWHPRFSYFGFRYLQAEGGRPSGQPADKRPELLSVEGQFVYADVSEVGQFTCSNELFNNIHQLVIKSILSNTQSVLTDCPHREKLGWLDPVQFMGPSIMYNYDVPAFYTKLLRDIAEAQLPNGLVPNTAPEYFVTGMRETPEWGLTYPIAAWLMYQRYGDGSILEEHYQGLKRCLEYFESRADRDGLLTYGFSDWAGLFGDPPYLEKTPLGVTATAILYEAQAILTEIARLLNHTVDAELWRRKAGATREAFNRRFLNRETAQYATGSQTANCMALALGLAPDELRAGILKNVIDDVRARGNAVSSGEAGHQFVLLALGEEDRSDVVFDMHSQSEKPGYGYQLKRGATTLIENWDASPSSSQNHCMHRQIEEWFYRYLGGIHVQHDSSGVPRVVYKPTPVGHITTCRVSYESVYGRLDSAWERTPTALQFSISVPANIDAEVHLPARSVSSISEANLSVFLRDDGLWVGYMETPNLAEAQRALASREVNQRWQKAVAPYFEGLENKRPDDGFLQLEEIFHLD